MNVDEIMRYDDTKLKELPTGVKQMIAAYILINPKNAIDVLKNCDYEIYGDLICNNRELFDILWMKYVNKNLGNTKNLNLKDFKNLLLSKIELYNENAQIILLSEKGDIIYENAKNTAKLINKIIEENKENKDNMDIIKKLIDKLVYVDQYYKDVNALDIAVYYKRIDIIKLLIDKGSDVNKSKRKLTALAEAVQFNSFEIAKLLLENGADPNITSQNTTVGNDNELFTYLPIKYAVKNGKTKMFNLLVKYGADVTLDPSILEDATKNLYITKYLIEHGISLKYITKALVSVIWQNKINSFKIAKYLIEHGADINNLNYFGYTALTLANKQGNKKLVDYLIKLESNKQI